MGTSLSLCVCKLICACVCVCVGGVDGLLCTGFSCNKIQTHKRFQRMNIY